MADGPRVTGDIFRQVLDQNSVAPGEYSFNLISVTHHRAFHLAHFNIFLMIILKSLLYRESISQ